MDIEIERADSFLKKLRGLMFRRRIDHGLLFTLNNETRSGAAIHSFFVFFEFDAVFMNSDKEIVDLRRDIKPFDPLIVPRKPSKFILELPAGMIDEEDLVIGQELHIG